MVRSLAIVVGGLVLVAVAWLVLRPIELTTRAAAPPEAAGEEGSRRGPTLVGWPARVGKPADVKDIVLVPGLAPAGRTTYRFHVVMGAGGKPIRGATVSASASATLGTTDAEGALTVDVENRYTIGFVSVVVRHAGFAEEAVTAKQWEICEVRLVPAAHILGRVVMAATEAPVAGARVTVYRDDRKWRVGESALTDREGRFRIEGTRVGSAYVAVVHVEGRATRTQTFVQDGPEAERLIQLPKGGEIFGVVHAARDSFYDDRLHRFQPQSPVLAGVPVTASAADGSLPPDPSLDGELEGDDIYRADSADRTTADAEGRYRIEGLPLGVNLVAVARSTPLLFARSDPIQFSMVGGTVQRDIRLPSGGYFRVVLEGVDAKQSPDIQLMVRTKGFSVPDAQRFRSDHGYSGERVSWEFQDLAPGSYDVRVMGLGLPFVSRSAEVVAWETTEVRIAFRGELTVVGQVVADGGQPVPHPNVWWTGSTSTFTIGDSEGKFRLEGLDDALGTLTAAAGERPEGSPPLARARREDVKPGGEPLLVVLGKTARLHMRLEGLAKGADVEANIETPSFHENGGRGDRQPDGTFEMRVDQLGSPVVLTMSAAGFAKVRLEVPSLSAGEVRDLGLVKFEEGRTLDIRVTDETEAPRPGAVVTLADTWAREEQATADAMGVARFAHMPRRAIRVVVTSEGHAPHLSEVPADGAGPFVVRLSAEGTLAVHVVDRNGSPATRARVCLLPADGDPFDPEPEAATRWITADDHGALSERVQARGYRLRARGGQGDGEVRVGDVTVRSGETTEVTVRLR